MSAKLRNYYIKFDTEDKISDEICVVLRDCMQMMQALGENREKLDNQNIYHEHLLSPKGHQNIEIVSSFKDAVCAKAEKREFNLG